jgi:hypothetical protein
MSVRHLILLFVVWGFLFAFVSVLMERISLCSPGWCATHHKEQGTLELLSQLPWCWDYKCAPPTSGYLISYVRRLLSQFSSDFSLYQI